MSSAFFVSTQFNAKLRTLFIVIESVHFYRNLQSLKSSEKIIDCFKIFPFS